MVNDPELKAMSEVYDVLNGLDAATQKRVVDLVLDKLKSTGGSITPITKRGPKPGTKRARLGRKPKAAASKTTGAKRGPKPGSKRGPKAGKRGRPATTGEKTSSQPSSGGGRRGRPKKNPMVS